MIKQWNQLQRSRRSEIGQVCLFLNVIDAGSTHRCLKEHPSNPVLAVEADASGEVLKCVPIECTAAVHSQVDGVVVDSGIMAPAGREREALALTCSAPSCQLVTAYSRERKKSASGRRLSRTRNSPGLLLMRQSASSAFLSLRGPAYQLVRERVRIVGLH